MYILTPKLVLGVQYEQNRLLSYIYKCTELRFYHKANIKSKQQNHTRLPWWTNKKEKCEKRKNNATKKTDERYDI